MSHATFAAPPNLKTGMDTIVSRYFHTTDNVRLHFLETLPPSAVRPGPVIVLVPGWSMPASLWHRQMELIGRHWHTIALDPRGQGLSEVPPHGYHIDRRADDIHELMKRFPQVIAVGWSLGALEVLQAIHRHGHSGISGLVLIDTSVGEGAASGPSRFPEELRRNRRFALTEFSKAIFRNARPAKEIRALVKQAMRMPLEASLSLFPASVPREHWRSIVHGYAGPLLYAVTPQFFDQARLLSDSRPETRIELFQDSGHALFVDSPDRFSRILGEFVSATQKPR